MVAKGWQTSLDAVEANTSHRQFATWRGQKECLLARSALSGAAGVEPAISVENTQLTESENASIAKNATISKSAVQPLYKDCQESPELQPSDISPQMRGTLKCSWNI
jgi:hypothetical protein